ncbi:hypothetical protein GQ568_02655 [Patescibacteria group bacterium]|nr:hypothetical protein [Patescibacteria group bacterium]
MSKENEEEEVESTEEETTKVEKTEVEETDWEDKFNKSEDRNKETEGRLKRAETKLSKSKTKDKEPDDSSKLDYGKKAFLVANGIKGSKELELVQKVASETGKTLEEVLESKYFKADLEEMRELDKTEDATPKGSKRTGQSSGKDTVDYWIKKGDLPTDRKLRQDVVNARISKERGKNVFE